MKKQDFYIDDSGQKIAYIFDRQGNIIDTDKTEPHAWVKKRKCPMCGGIMTLRPLDVSYAIRGNKIFFAETRPENGWKFTLITHIPPLQAKWTLGCQDCVFGRDTTIS